MRFFGFDTETHLIQPGLLTPSLVCGSVAEMPEPGPNVVETAGPSIRKASGWVLDKYEALTMARTIFSDSEVVTVGANFAYDCGVLAAAESEILPAIFGAYRDGRIFDIQIAQALDAIARGHLFRDPETHKELRMNGKKSRYSLDMCVRLELGRTDAKENDFWRSRYALLEGVPVSEWPVEAVQYPVDDAVNTLEVCLKQLETHFNLGDLAAQCETAWAMHLGAIWGIRTDPERVGALESKVDEWYGHFVDRFKSVGFLRSDDAGKDAGKEDSSAVKRAVAKAYGASGICSECGGTGHVRSMKTVPCRGVKFKNKFQGCTGAGCVVCGGRTTVVKVGGEIICKKCDGTGFDLSTAPTLPTTDKGKISTDRDTLSETDDADLHDYSDNEPDKIRTSYIPFLRMGLERPINLRPNVLVESGRTSYDGPIQLIPRSGGVRECFKARDEYRFVSVDYAALELCTLAQSCIWLVGHSRMAEVINETKDPGALHTAFAAKMIGCTPQEMQARLDSKDKAAKSFRQAAKPGNFMLPGGGGAVTLVLTNRKKAVGVTEGASGRKYSGVRFCILLDGAAECGVEKITEWKGRTYPPVCKRCVELVEYHLKPAWLQQWPEMVDYFAWVTRTLKQTEGLLPCLGPWAAEGMHDWADRAHRVRGGLNFTAGCNSFFQSLAADGGKSALRNVVREAYLDEASPLFGTRPIMFVHDEIFSEVPCEKLHEAAKRKAQIMVESMRVWVPDVHINAEPAAMTHWYKEAEAVYDESGRLIPWEPKAK